MAAETNEQTTEAPPQETTRFELGGVEYELPPLLEMTIDEWEFVYDACGVTISDLAPLAAYDEHGTVKDGNAEADNKRREKLRNPRFIRAWATIGLQRSGVDAAEAAGMVGAASMAELTFGKLDQDTVDPTSTTKQERSSERSLVEISPDSSTDSPKNSETPDEQHATTGTSG